VTFKFCIQFAGRKAAAFEVTAAVSPDDTTLIRTPLVDETEPGKLTANWHVRFVPIADILRKQANFEQTTRFRLPRQSALGQEQI
jgi:hypothetical protein